MPALVVAQEQAWPAAVGEPFEDADQGAGVIDFHSKGKICKQRRALAKNFWAD